MQCLAVLCHRLLSWTQKIASPYLSWRHLWPGSPQRPRYRRWLRVVCWTRYTYIYIYRYIHINHLLIICISEFTPTHPKNLHFKEKYPHRPYFQRREARPWPENHYISTFIFISVFGTFVGHWLRALHVFRSISKAFFRKASQRQ